jgi:hypothetical protein
LFRCFRACAESLASETPAVSPPCSAPIATSAELRRNHRANFSPDAKSGIDELFDVIAGFDALVPNVYHAIT